MFHFHHKTFIDEVKVAMQVALFKEKDMHHVASDRSKTPYGIYIILAGTLLGAIGRQFTSFAPSFFVSIISALIQVISMILGIYILSFIAEKLFNGHGKHDHFFRVATYSTIVTWLGLIPLFGFISGIWCLVLLYVVLKLVHKLSATKAVLTILVGMLVAILMGIIFSPIYRFGGWQKSFDNKNYKMHFNNTNESGSVEMNENKMKIKTGDGQVFEMNIPK